MSTAAYSSPGDRMSDWLEELERILTGFDTLPSAAQDAVNSVVESLLHEPDPGDTEIDQLNALLAARSPGYGGLHQRRASPSQTPERDTLAAALTQAGPGGHVAGHAHIGLHLGDDVANVGADEDGGRLWHIA